MSLPDDPNLDDVLPPVEPEIGDDDAADADAPITEEEIEEQARAQGWRPESEWDERRAEREGRRKPAQFLTAKEFLAKEEERAPVRNARMKKVERELDDVKRKYKEAMDLVGEQQREHAAAAIRIRADERAKVEAEMRTAVAEGDLEAHDKAMSKLKDMDKQDREQAAPPRQDRDAEVDDWVANNKWFTDPDKSHLNATMIREHKGVQKSHPHLSKIEHLELAKKRVKARFPDEWGMTEAAPRGPGGAEMPTNRRDPGRDSVEARFARLDVSAKNAYESLRNRFAARKITYTKEEYLKEYVG